MMIADKGKKIKEDLLTDDFVFLIVHSLFTVPLTL